MAFESLYKEIFGAEADLKKVAGSYPYFIPAHFFRLQQSNPGENDYNDIAAKTALHFANPWLLNQQLHSEETVVDEIEVPGIEILPGNNVPEPVTEDIKEESFEHRVEVMEEAPVAKEPLVASEVVILDEPAPPPREVIEEHPVVIEAKKEDHPPLLFEPLHTTDYFASQGIKLSEVVLSGDKMGKQLKSFTDWLKTMKKIHPAGDKPANDTTIDASVQKLAEKSNQEEEVLTESMAAVYLQQGRTNKAKEIYEKLSLLNPAKSAYFAAKLNEIQ